MSRLFDDLHPEFRSFAIELVARCSESGVPVMIVDTLRTPQEHQLNLARGVSWTQHSKHLDGLAIDICPYEQYQLHGPDKLAWNGKDLIWKEIGVIGKRLGLKWGGDWKKRDMGHFEHAYGLKYNSITKKDEYKNI